MSRMVLQQNEEANEAPGPPPLTVTAPGPLRAERSVAEPVPADRRLRVPVRLREHLPDLVGRFGGVAVRAAARLAQRVRRDPGPRRRALPARALRRVGARRAALPARQPDPGDHLADPHRLDDRARRAGDGPVARHRGPVAHAPPHADGLGRRAHPAAHGALRERHGRAGDELRAVVRLPPDQRHLGVLGQAYGEAIARASQRPRRASDAAADHQPAHRAGGPRGAGPHPDERGRQRLRRAELVQAPGAADLRRGRRQDVDRPASAGGSGSTSATSPTTRGGPTCSAAR